MTDTRTTQARPPSAAGIAPASLIPHVIMQKASCVDDPRSFLHAACTDLALRELVMCWHQLTADVREKIMEAAGSKRLSPPIQYHPFLCHPTTVYPCRSKVASGILGIQHVSRPRDRFPPN
jgi:hypothetical protein